MLTDLLNALTTPGPKVRLGTKCPSMTSICMPSTPASSASFACCPRRAKSALRMEGSMEIRDFTLTASLNDREIRTPGRVLNLQDKLGHAGRCCWVQRLGCSLCQC